MKATFEDTDTLTRAGVCQMAKQNVADGLFGSSAPWCRSSGHTADWEATYKELDRLERCRSNPPPNQSPTLTRSLPDLSLSLGEQATVNLNEYISDPEQETITWTASSSNAAVSISTSGPLVTVSAESSGTATISVTATDPHGGALSASFGVDVAPLVAAGNCQRPVVRFGRGRGACYFRPSPSNPCGDRVDDQPYKDHAWPPSAGVPDWPKRWTGGADPAANEALDRNQDVGPLAAYFSCWSADPSGRFPSTEVRDGNRPFGDRPPFQAWLGQADSPKIRGTDQLTVRGRGPGLSMIHLVIPRGYYIPDQDSTDGEIGIESTRDYVPTYVEGDRFVVSVNSDDWLVRLMNEPVRGAKHWDFGRGDGWYGLCEGSYGKPIRVDVRAFHGSVTCRAKPGDRVNIAFFNVGSASGDLNEPELLDDAKGIVHLKTWKFPYQARRTVGPNYVVPPNFSSVLETFRYGRSDAEDTGARTTFRLIVE